MKGTRRKAILASVLALVGTAMTVPMVVSGTASAQTNARLCGRWFYEENESGAKEVLVHLYEVDKGRFETCNYAKATVIKGAFGQPVDFFDPWNNNPFAAIHRDIFTPDGVLTDDFDQEVCETWKDRPLRLGGLGGKELNFIGDNFPKKTPDNDICNYLNRSEDLLNMESYWMSWSFSPAGPGRGDGIPGEKVDIIHAKH